MSLKNVDHSFKDAFVNHTRLVRNLNILQAPEVRDDLTHIHSYNFFLNEKKKKKIIHIILKESLEHIIIWSNNFPFNNFFLKKKKISSS